MMNNQEAARLARWVDPFESVREILLDANKSCIERINSAWPHLENLPSTDLPSSFRPQWASISERAGRLAGVTVEQAAPSHVDEAGDIGTILLCFEWLLRRDLIPATVFEMPVYQTVEARPIEDGPMAHRRPLADES
jgi:hypothetical protein